MKRWDSNVNHWTDVPDVEAFLEEVVAVCRRHNMTISQEDTGRVLGVRRGFDPGEDGADWIMQASASKDSVKSATAGRPAWQSGKFEFGDPITTFTADATGEVTKLTYAPPDPGLAPQLRPVETEPGAFDAMNKHYGAMRDAAGVGRGSDGGPSALPDPEADRSSRRGQDRAHVCDHRRS